MLVGISLHRMHDTIVLRTFNDATSFLPSAYIVRGKVLFSQVCLFTFGGGGGTYLLGRGVPTFQSGGGGTYLGRGGYLPWQAGGVPTLAGGVHTFPACACYAAGSMPLAFTQEDFLVYNCYLCRLGADISVLRERQVESLEPEPRKRVAEVLIRKVPENQQFIDLRLAVLGNVDAGKSTLLGVLTQGELDNGRGRARLNLFRHLHEIQSGRTSSISHEILGFNSKGEVRFYTLK